jgi:hypothetical protein
MKEQNLQSVCPHNHGGVLPIAIGTIWMKVETKDGEGATFIISLLNHTT